MSPILSNRAYGDITSLIQAFPGAFDFVGALTEWAEEGMKLRKRLGQASKILISRDLRHKLCEWPSSSRYDMFLIFMVEETMI